MQNLNQTRKATDVAEHEVEHPHRLVLHPDSQDKRRVEAGTADEIAYFGKVVESARGIPGLREISLDLSQVEVQGTDLLHQVGRRALEYGFDFSAVATSVQVEQWGVAAFSSCREVALLIDTVRYPTLKLTPEFYHQVDHLQAESRVVSFHVLLDSDLIRRLKLPRLRRWLDRADFVTLVTPRGAGIGFEQSDLATFFEQLTPLWEKADRFFHLRVDRKLKPAFFPWNLLSVACPAADLALHLGADGRLFVCADADPFAVLSHPRELAAAVLAQVQKKEVPADPSAGRSFPGL